MSERWLRWYDGTTRDGKIQLVAKLTELPACTILGIWASMLEDAATSDPRGITAKGLEYHSMYLGIAAHEIGTVWNAMERLELIESVPGREGCFEVINWHKRQFTTDGADPTAKDRKERWKQAHKKGGTARNGAERSGTPETESKTKTDKNIVDLEFEKFKRAYPKRKGSQGWPTAHKYFIVAIRAGQPADNLILAAQKFAASLPGDQDPKFVPMAETWMRKQSWKEFLPTPEDAAKERMDYDFMRSKGYEWDGEKWAKAEAIE